MIHNQPLLFIFDVEKTAFTKNIVRCLNSYQGNRQILSILQLDSENYER